MKGKSHCQDYRHAPKKIGPDTLARIEPGHALRPCGLRADGLIKGVSCQTESEVSQEPSRVER